MTIFIRHQTSPTLEVLCPLRARGNSRSRSNRRKRFLLAEQRTTVSSKASSSTCHPAINRSSVSSNVIEQVPRVCVGPVGSGSLSPSTYAVVRQAPLGWCPGSRLLLLLSPIRLDSFEGSLHRLPLELFVELWASDLEFLLQGCVRVSPESMAA